MPWNRKVQFGSLTCVEKHAWNFHLGAIQASLFMDDLSMDDCSIKNVHSSVLALEEPYGQAWSWLIS